MAEITDGIIEAQAHLYVGVAKADGVVDKEEFTHIPYYAQKSQRFFKMMKIDETKGAKVSKIIRDIFRGKEFSQWNSSKHLDRAVEILKNAREDGVWATQVVFTKNEEGLLSSAKIGGYLIKESRFIERMEAALNQI